MRVVKLFGVLVLGFVSGFFIFQEVLPAQEDVFIESDDHYMTLEANGYMEWFWEDHHIKDDSYNAGFPTYRLDTSGDISIKAFDYSPLDHPDSKDSAEVEANFKGPGGEDFKIVLVDLLPGNEEWQLYGGVSKNHLIHGQDVATGNPEIMREFSYLSIFGFFDLYRDGELIDPSRAMFIVLTEKAFEDDFRKGNKKPADMDNLIVHVVSMVHSRTPEGDIVKSKVPTGIINPNGEEQDFLHFNYYENIKITGNRFLK